MTYRWTDVGDSGSDISVTDVCRDSGSDVSVTEVADLGPDVSWTDVGHSGSDVSVTKVADSGSDLSVTEVGHSVSDVNGDGSCEIAEVTYR